MRTHHLIVAGLLLVGCKKETPNERPAPAPAASADLSAKAPPKVPEASAERDAAFWTWFRDHRVEMARVKRANEPVAGQLADELHRVDPRLTFELGTGIEPKELIISADGLREAFPAVQRLVAAAPPIAGWKAVAFRPRKDPGLTIEMGDGMKLSGKDLYFMVLPTSRPPAPMDIIVYTPGLGGKDDDGVKQVAYLLLDATLGEYDVETKVGGIAWKPITEKPASAKPFRDLPKVVDAWK